VTDRAPFAARRLRRGSDHLSSSRITGRNSQPWNRAHP
jgi:hypothetical protein